MSINDNDHIEKDVIDELHIPHVNFLQLNTDNEDVAIKSLQDKSLREFGVRFFLEDLRAGTNWAYVNLKEDLSQSTGPNSDKFNIN